MSDASLNVKLKLDLSDVESQLKGVSDYAKKSMSGNVGGGSGKSLFEKDLNVLKQVMKAEENLASQRAKNEASIAAAQKRRLGAGSASFGGGIAGVPQSGKEFQAQFNQLWKEMESESDLIAQLRKGFEKSFSKIHTPESEQLAGGGKEQFGPPKELFKHHQEQQAIAEKEKQQREKQLEKNAIAASRINIAIRNRAEKEKKRKEESKNGVSASVAFAGMLRSLIMYRAITESFGALKKSVDAVVESYARAQKIYAKSLTSGLGVGQTTKRGILASAIGVSEDEVMRFGDAVSYLNPKIEKASKVLADTATPLTAVYLNFQSLKVSAQALFSTIAMNLKPAIEDIITGFQEMIDSITADDINMMGDFLRSLLGIMLQAGAVVAAVIGGLVTGFEVLAASINTIGAVIYNFIQQLVEWAAKLQSKIAQGAAYLGARSAGATKEEASKIAKGQAEDEYKQVGGGKQVPIAIEDLWKGAASSAQMTQEITDKLGKMSLDVLTGSGKESKERLAQPKPFMKQISASSWEKMGLVIGGGMGNTTNDLIRTSNQHLKIIADHVSGRGGVPRAFGLNPNVANP